MAKKIFGAVMPDDCDKAITELKRLSVYNVMNDDCTETFADVWFHVQHECDMYEEGEYSNCLTYQGWVGASNWLERYRDLYDKYETR